MSNLSSKRKSKIKKNKKSKIKLKRPEWSDFLDIKPYYCKGITPKGEIFFKQRKLDDFNDFYCVIKKYKPVAIVGISDFDIIHYNKYSNIVNKLINLANKKQVKVIIREYYSYNWFSSILKTKEKKIKFRRMVVFYKKDILRAILALYIFTTERGAGLSSAYLTGKILGYSEKNIRGFYYAYDRLTEYEKEVIPDISKYYKDDKKYYKKDIKIIINSKDYKKFKEKYIKHIRDIPTLEEMNKRYLKK